MHPTNRWLLVVFLIGAIVLSACGGSPAAPAPAPAPAPTSAPAANAPAAPAPTAAPAATAVPAATTAPAANVSSGTLNRDPKTLVIAYQESADNVDPAQTLNVANNIVTRPIYEGLLTLKGSSLTEVEPVLAESFTTNADKSEWTFKIRKGVKFHDGGVCDAQAIYDSIARTIVNKMPTWNILGRFVGEDPAKTMKVVDPNTLQFKFERSQPLFSLALAAAYGTGIISPKAFKEHEKNGDAGKEWLTTHADGTGPYKLDKFAPNDEFVLVRNPDYWRGWDDPNKFEKVIIKIYPENSTRRQLLEKGDVDIFTTPSAEDVEALQQTGNFEIGNADLIRIDYIAFNTHGKLADPRVRQAINYAFDYDGYIKGVRKDQGRRAEGPFPRSMVYHDPGVFVYPTDLAKAKELLTQAGWVDGTEVTYAYYPGFHGEDVGPILQAQLEQIGVKLKIEEQDISAFNGVFYGDQPPAQRPDMFWYAWWPNLDDPYDWSWILYHSTAAGSNGANAGFYSNKRVDQLIDQGLTETDPAKLTAIWKELQNTITKDDPAGMWVEDPLDHTIFRKDIAGQVYNAVYTESFDFWALSRKP
jgi:peptide/nickel transport system substrate-binding protein